ncbi:radical SAM protein [Candidatus Woesearchaeota archaeon]|nr:radical SAM protein [Candidatus Woesearchaeota archaeon]
MAKLTFSTLSFNEREDCLQVTLLKLFVTKIPKKEVEAIASFKVINAHTINFDYSDEEKISTKFGFLLAKYFEYLTTKLTGNKATYIHRNSGIPLIGNVAFGIVHRGSSIIEIKPTTSCNLDCVYCSIAEGLSSKKNDFVVEEEYLIEEFQKVVDFLGEPVEAHIGVQGEPFLYGDIEKLIEDLQAMESVHTISIDSNGTLLSKDKIDRLVNNTKLQLNLSLDAIDEVAAKKIAGVKNYNVNHVKEMIAYASERLNVIVAPVFTNGYNNEEMEKIIIWIKTLKVQPKLGIQNFLRYKTGRNAAKEISWEEFYTMIKQLEDKHDIKLKLNKEDFNIKSLPGLPKPFYKGEKVNATIVCVDRFPNSVLAVSKGRTISVPNCVFKKDKKIVVEILRDKHNIFTGKVIK